MGRKYNILTIEHISITRRDLHLTLLRAVFTSDGVVVGVVIRSLELMI